MDTYQMTKDFTCQSLDRILINYYRRKNQKQTTSVVCFFHFILVNC
ncbi:hypothetical protein HGO97_021795 [Faecalicatena sp. AGMB00832]|uniref:Uncharacterized protein n=1 Tax=Faecalicatena faecalis TaxID=2726362 RepID=A0ABS6DBF0_9FIRM|nr:MULTISPECIES: hypothetical protein [Faecalicatena]MBU3878441.1 hypothetical protein [Faecalicatena faecalis]MCI6464446.1 hypothetical protein [Faecalicatena sp.]MDY5618324.1 hypothetical protein [Lachnospiraceae bacterium]